MYEMVEDVLHKAQQAGADDIVVSGLVTKDLQTKFSSNKVDVNKKWEIRKIALLMAFGKKVITAEVSDLTNIGESVDRIAKLAKLSKESAEYGGIAQGPFSYDSIKVDQRLVEFDDLSAFSAEAIDTAKEHGASETAGIVHKRHRKHYIQSSGEVRGDFESVGIYLSIRAFSDELASGHSCNCSTSLSDFSPIEAAEEAAHIARMARKPVEGKEGNYDIILSPFIFASFVNSMGFLASAFNVSAGLSPLAGNLGKEVATRDLTMSDDATEDTIGKRLFDDEGVPTSSTKLIERGILKTYLHNTSTAKRMGAKSTGNAGLIVPVPFSLIVEKGDWKAEEILSEAKDALYLTNTWYTRYQNRVTGDFSSIPRDGIFRVKGGEVVESWRNIRISDNMLNLFKSVECLSRERKEVMWYSLDCPAVVPWAFARNIKVTRSLG